ncbi:MAG: hypothetical protein NTV57_05945, partial [Cyanobacteria bacterium]|nr:hypothetical protein [Cyanobacteriota bacterium]
SASEIPAGGMVIAGDLYLKCNRGSSWRQGLKWGHRSRRASRPLNGYVSFAASVRWVTALAMSTKAGLRFVDSSVKTHRYIKQYLTHSVVLPA